MTREKKFKIRENFSYIYKNELNEKFNNFINICFRCMYFIIDKKFVVILIKVRMKYFKHFQIQKEKINKSLTISAKTNAF